MELIERVKNLEAETVILKSRFTKKVKSLKSRHHTVKTAPENDVITSGIPSDCKDSPQRLVDCMFAALDTSDLSHQVNKMRIIKCNSAVTAKVTRSSNCDQTSTDCKIPVASDFSVRSGKTKSILVSFKSALARDNLINSKRIKRDLTTKEVFSRNIIGNVYVNEFLPSTVYHLLFETRSGTKKLGYKYTWVSNGKIFVKKRNGCSVVSINTVNDLAMRV